MQISFNNLTAFLTSLLLLVSGCTTARYQYKTPATATEENQLACEVFAQSEAEIIRGDSVAGILVPTLLMGPLGTAIAVGAFPRYYELLKQAHERDKQREKAYAGAMKACREPEIETADWIRVAGTRYYNRKQYADAEVLYRWALEIEAKLSHEEFLARILEDYGQLMWVTDRRVEGQQMIIRARSIRAKLDQQKQIEAKTDAADNPNR